VGGLGAGGRPITNAGWNQNKIQGYNLQTCRCECCWDA